MKKRLICLSADIPSKSAIKKIADVCTSDSSFRTCFLSERLVAFFVGKITIIMSRCFYISPCLLAANF